MIGVHILIPKEKATEIYELLSPTFELVGTGTTSVKNLTFFHVITTEQEMVFLKLKYGNANVWPR